MIQQCVDGSPLANLRKTLSFDWMSVAFPALTSLVEKVALEVVKDGGVVRSVQNHGIRDLPHRIKAKRPDLFGKRYYDKGRFVSVYYDGNPNTNRMIENVLVFNDEVIRRATLKARNPLWYVNIAREEKNPYIRRVQRMEYSEQR